MKPHLNTAQMFGSRMKTSASVDPGQGVCCQSTDADALMIDLLSHMTYLEPVLR